MATNNERERQNIPSNTYGYVSRNYETQTALAVNYFNKMASVSIHLPSSDKKGEYTSFDYSSGVTAYLTPKDCKLLAKRGHKALKALEETGQFDGFAIPLKRGLVEIIQVAELRKKIRSLTGDANPSDVAVVIYTEMNEEDKKTSKFLAHVFNMDLVIKGYSPETGDYDKERESIEFEYFLSALSQFANAMTNGYVHAQKEDSKYERTKWERNVFELAAALNVDLSKPGARSNNNTNRGKDGGWGSAPSGDERYAGGKDTTRYSAEIVNASEDEVDNIIKQML